MFSFKTFIQAIQGSVLNANEALMDKNLEVLSRYFEKDDDNNEIQQKIDEAIEATSEVTGPNRKVDKPRLNNALESLKNLRDTLQEDDAIANMLTEGEIRPKTVILNYPTNTSDGSLIMKEVHVPLITLIPLQFSKVDELKLQAELELGLADDEVHVSFGKIAGNGKDDSGETTKRSIGNIEITLKPMEVSDGMEQIIEAYEKILKSQLPH